MRFRSRSNVRSSCHTRGKSSTRLAMACWTCVSSCKRAFHSASRTEATSRFSGSTRKKRAPGQFGSIAGSFDLLIPQVLCRLDLGMQFFIDLQSGVNCERGQLPPATDQPWLHRALRPEYAGRSALLPAPHALFGTRVQELDAL